METGRRTCWHNYWVTTETYVVRLTATDGEERIVCAIISTLDGFEVELTPRFPLDDVLK